MTLPLVAFALVACALIAAAGLVGWLFVVALLAERRDLKALLDLRLKALYGDDRATRAPEWREKWRVKVKGQEGKQ